MVSVDWLGYAAGSLVVISLVPQIVKSWRTKRTNDLSLLRYLIYFFGIILWLIYGFLLSNGPMMIANSITLALASSILYLKIRYG